MTDQETENSKKPLFIKRMGIIVGSMYFHRISIVNSNIIPIFYYDQEVILTDGIINDSF